ncbi:hypothetical protein PRUPE_3G153000 [Prunus persica]|uniref:Uncharacterized protein n=1 Tax=Prunus persica TaxID=3760 RepID=M5WZF9_PRUPE|nr:hypothetical protein PRUPE_3G153000 [Prunus persica]
MHEHQLAYISGDTKIIVIDRNIKLASFCDTLNDVVYFKYQVPGEDLNAFISVINDKNLDHMIIEYYQLYRTFAKPARLKLFFFALSNNPLLTSAPMGPGWSPSGLATL